MWLEEMKKNGVTPKMDKLIPAKDQSTGRQTSAA
jgi:hypothetical protein